MIGSNFLLFFFCFKLFVLNQMKYIVRDVGDLPVLSDFDSFCYLCLFDLNRFIVVFEVFTN
jgi:hypothetical protein